MTPNVDINDHAREDDVTAYVMRLATANDHDGVMCVRFVRAPFEHDGEEFPAKVEYECRKRSQVPGRSFTGVSLTLDADVFAACGDDAAALADLVLDELDMVFG